MGVYVSLLSESHGLLALQPTAAKFSSRLAPESSLSSRAQAIRNLNSYIATMRLERASRIVVILDAKPDIDNDLTKDWQARLAPCHLLNTRVGMSRTVHSESRGWMWVGCTFQGVSTCEVPTLECTYVYT